MKKVYSLVTNDIATDQRVLRICDTIAQMGYQVSIIGRKLPSSPAVYLNRVSTVRFNMIFKHGVLFYTFFNIRLLFYLLAHNPHIVIANDADTLLSAWLFCRLTGRKLLYDSHELFSEVPEVQHRAVVKYIWKSIENIIIPKIKFGITVCNSIADYYKQKYNVHFTVIRNVPYRVNKLVAGDNENIILYQGAVNIGRGIDLMIDAMQFLEGYKLVIAGNGDVLDQMKDRATSLNLNEKVRFTGRLMPDKLALLTQKAALGLSLEENLGLNYFYALPNKLFSYIQAHVPVITSDFPEMKKIVENYGIGLTLKTRRPEELARQISLLLHDTERIQQMKVNLQFAANDLCWENESKLLTELIQRLTWV